MMLQDLHEWQQELGEEGEEEYKALVRSLLWTDGFSLFFVRCSPAMGENIITRVRGDVSQKKMEILALTEAVDSLYDKVEELVQRKKVDILFITGLEYSLLKYEETNFDENDSERFSYSWKGVPRVLGHLNLQRDRFRDRFNISFVFILPLFAIKYFIHRAPDFFDWRSGISNLFSNQEFFKECSLTNFSDLSLEEKQSRLEEIHILIETENNYEEKSKLLQLNGSLLMKSKHYEEAISRFNESLHLKPKDISTLEEKALSLMYLGRYQESIETYDIALTISPDNCKLSILRGRVFRIMGDKKIALNNFEQSIRLNKDCWCAWTNKGNLLTELGLFEEAINSYDKSIEINSKSFYNWFYKAQTLASMGLSEDAISAYAKAIEIQPDHSTAWHNRALALAGIGHYEEAVVGYKKSIELSDNITSWMCLAGTLRSLNRYDESIATYKKVLERDYNCHWAWSGQMISLLRLGRYKDFIISVYHFFRSFRFDFHFKEWLGRRVSIDLRRLDLPWLVPVWTKVLRLFGLWEVY